MSGHVNAGLPAGRGGGGEDTLRICGGIVRTQDRLGDHDQRLAERADQANSDDREGSATPATAVAIAFWMALTLVLIRETTSISKFQ